MIPAVSVPGPSFHLRWTPTPADLADAHDAQGPRPPLNPVVRYVGAVGALVAGAGLLLAGHTGAAAASVAVALVLVAARRRPTRRARSSRVLASSRAYAPTEAVVDQGGVRVNGRATPWSAYTGCTETQLSFVLLGPPRAVPTLTYLPKRATPDVAGLRALLAAALRPPT